ncbi:hypothetical protein Celaphus_00008060, partial [Cervus elaphus hippelaphus]
MQAPGGVPSEEATFYWVEAVEEGAVLEEGEVAGIGQEDEQEQVSLEEQGQEYPRPRALSDRPALEALVALQLQLEPVNKKAQRAHARLKRKNCQRRTLHLEHRSAIIQGIRGFCIEVVSFAVVLVIFFFFFRMMTKQDRDMLHSMTNLKVRQGTLIVVEGRSNSLVSLVRGSSLDLGGGGRKVAVELERDLGYRASRSTPNQWHQGFEHKAYSHRNHNSSVNFFNWLSDHSFTGSDQIAEVGSQVGTGPELVIYVGVLGGAQEGSGPSRPCTSKQYVFTCVRLNFSIEYHAFNSAK